jgi:hypothetical protein
MFVYEKTKHWKYKNKDRLKHLKRTYRRNFGCAYKISKGFDGWSYSINQCGFEGGYLYEYEKLMEMVASKDRRKLRSWLSSSSFNLQIYAIDGFYQLQKAGIKLNDKEMLYINNIMKKNGKVITCNGCEFFETDAQTIFTNFSFNQ